MKTKRGQKLCKKCNAINGVRAYNCKECDEPFEMKNGRKKKQQIITDHMILKKGDRIRVVGGSGPYYLSNDTKKYMTKRGEYIVSEVSHDGIDVHGGSLYNAGHSFLYMGKVKQSSLIDGLQCSPHKIILLNNVSSHLRRT